ncbi:MAG: class I SAM-dependent methyltransferase [Acidimicrobiia bacterium]
MTDPSLAAGSSRLDEIAAHYDPSNPEQEFDYYLKRLQVATAGPWLRGRRLLELGCATGELSSLLAPLADEYHVVEGSIRNIEAARPRVPGATFVHSLWEQFEPEHAYSDIVAFNALEHAAEPVALLTQARRWLEPGGRLHVVVPNGLSLHRLVGVEMGMLVDPVTLSDGDRSQGHFRNYTIDTLKSDVAAADLAVVHWQGIFLKVLSNRQMLGWDWDLIHALHRVAQRFPEHCAELYLVATPR